jgi:hypothetical protein
MISSLLLGLLLAAAAPPIPMQVSVEKTARELVANFNASRFQAATKDFNEDMLATATPAVLAEQKRLLEEAAGPFRAVTSARQVRQDGFRVVELTCRYEKVPVLFHITFDAYDRIGAVRMSPIVAPTMDPALEAAARAFVASFTAGRFEEAAKPFDAPLRAQLTVPKLTELGKTITSRYGNFRSVTEARPSLDGSYRVVSLTTAYDRSPVEVRVVFNAEGGIAGLSIGPTVATAATTTR